MSPLPRFGLEFILSDLRTVTPACSQGPFAWGSLPILSPGRGVYILGCSVCLGDSKNGMVTILLKMYSPVLEKDSPSPITH